MIAELDSLEMGVADDDPDFIPPSPRSIEALRREIHALLRLAKNGGSAPRPHLKSLRSRKRRRPTPINIHFGHVHPDDHGGCEITWKIDGRRVILASRDNGTSQDVFLYVSRSPYYDAYRGGDIAPSLLDLFRNN
jgi:hypothetical protein